MANRRMFSLRVVDTDEFLEMPQTSQLLYFHLAMRADDDGFVSNPKKIMKICGNGSDDLKVLITKRFIIPFKSGVCVIRHWRIHNLIRQDRYTETEYIAEKQTLLLNNGKYENKNVIPDGNQMAPQVRLGKVRLGKDNISTNKLVDTDKSAVSYGNEDINKVYNFLKDKLGGSPDGSQKENRRFAKLLLDRIKKDYPDKPPTDLICRLIELGMKDSFHSKNATNFKYFYYNAQKIIQSAKQQIINPKIITL